MGYFSGEDEDSLEAPQSQEVPRSLEPHTEARGARRAARSLPVLQLFFINCGHIYAFVPSTSTQYGERRGYRIAYFVRVGRIHFPPKLAILHPQKIAILSGCKIAYFVGKCMRPTRTK